MESGSPVVLPCDSASQVVPDSDMAGGLCPRLVRSCADASGASQPMLTSQDRDVLAVYSSLPGASAEGYAGLVKVLYQSSVAMHAAREASCICGSSGVASVTQSSPSVSVTSGSDVRKPPPSLSKSAVRRARRASLWRARSSVLSRKLPDGMCYARLLRPEVREAIVTDNGFWPTVGAVMSLSADMFPSLFGTSAGFRLLRTDKGFHVATPYEAEQQVGAFSCSLNDALLDLSRRAEFPPGSFGYKLAFDRTPLADVAAKGLLSTGSLLGGGEPVVGVPYFRQVECFSEVRTLGAVSGYDARANVSCLGRAETQLALFRLVDAWSAFSRLHDFKFWLAHGSLHGWWWNRAFIPWDVDVDVHVMYRALVQLSRLNGSVMVVGDRQYLFDVNPSYRLSEFDDSNRVDARWIEVQTGKFVDVTALDYDGHHNRLCARDRVCYDAADVFPLQSTTLLGVDVFVPRRPRCVLDGQYGSAVVGALNRHWHSFDTETSEWHYEGSLRAELVVLRCVVVGLGAGLLFVACRGFRSVLLGVVRSLRRLFARRVA